MPSPDRRLSNQSCQPRLAFSCVIGLSVGIFIKPGRSFVELRPLTKWVQLGYPGPKGWAKVRLRDPSDLTDEVKSLLIEAYDRVIAAG